MTKADLDGDHVFAVHDFLSPAECDEFIRMSRGLSWEVGTVGEEQVESVRNNERVLFDHPVLAADLFDRARPFLPAAIGRRPLVGFNERWRFYRYGPGQAFQPAAPGRVLHPDRDGRAEPPHLHGLPERGRDRRRRPGSSLGMEDAFKRRPYLTVAPRTGHGPGVHPPHLARGGRGDRRREVRPADRHHVRTARRFVTPDGPASVRSWGGQPVAERRTYRLPLLTVGDLTLRRVRADDAAETAGVPVRPGGRPAEAVPGAVRRRRDRPTDRGAVLR